jgi:hypothetical protein
MSKHSLIPVALAAVAGWFSSSAGINAQVTSHDTSFTPAVLRPGPPGNDGVVFRPPTGDLLVTQLGGGQVSVVNPTSGATSFFATQSAPDSIAVRSSDGLVAVTTSPFGPIDFYTSKGAAQGTPIPGSAIPVTPVAGADTVCITGIAFDTSGNLFVAAGPGSTAGLTTCLGSSTAWGIWEFAGPTPWTATPAFVTSFGDSTVRIEDIAYSAAKPPLGTLYAIDSVSSAVYEISLTPNCGECSIIFASFIASVPAFNPRGIAVDPLVGDIYVTDFAQNESGSDVYRVPAPGIEEASAPTIFASGFVNTFRLGFDTVGNLYINEYNAGNLWKFTRASNATALQPVTQGITNILEFTNPNPAMADQKQSILIPPSALMNGTAFIQDIFIPVDPSTLNGTLTNGTNGDTAFFGGAPVPSGTTCAPVPSAGLNNPLNPKCVVVVEKCYDINRSPFAICPGPQVPPPPSTDLIQLTFTFEGTQPANPAFLIGFDDGDGQDITDITIGADPGGTRGLCSKTFVGSYLTPESVDFTVTVSQHALDLTASNSGSATVTLTSFISSPATISLGTSDVPPGLSATLTSTPVNLPGNGNANSTLNVGLSTSSTISGIGTTIGSLSANNCIDNSGIVNALTSKVSAAQRAISGGQVQTAINTLTALSNQIRAQAGKHIATSCSTTFPMLVTASPFFGEVRFTFVNITLSPVAILNNEIQTIITSLKASTGTADPITGFVVNSGGVGVPGALVSLINSANAVVGTPATTDVTGFYYFSTTGTLSGGATYTIKVTGFPAGYSSATSYPSFVWGGKGLAFNFIVQ